MKKILAILLCTAMVLSLAACGGSASTSTSTPASEPASGSESSSSSEAPAKTKLVVGTSADYPPFEFIYLDDAGNQQYAGIDISFAEKLAEDAGLELEIVNMSFDNLMASLQKGDLDVVLAAIEASEERLKVADFSDPYYTTYPPLILTLKANADQYTKLEDFTGKTVGAQSGTTKADTVQSEMSFATPLLLTSVNDLVNNLIYGKCNAVVLDYAPAMQYAENNPDLVVLESVSLGTAEPYCAAVQKGDPSKLLESFNKTIETILADGTMDAYIAEADELSAKAIE